MLHLLAPARFGGLEGVVGSLAAMRHGLGRPTGVVAVLERPDPDLPLLASLEREGVPLFPLIVPARGYLRERELIKAVVRRFTPDILHTHGHRSDVIGATLRPGSAIRLVSTVHGFVRSTPRGEIYHWIQRLSYHAFDRIVVVSGLQRRQLERTLIPSRRIALIPNVTPEAPAPLPRHEARKLLGIRPQEFVVGWVGRLTHEKGADVLVRALAHIADSSIMASVIGDGRESTALRALAKDLRVEERVRWHGYQPDASRLYHAFDVFALSSRTEGIPLVLLEARQMGLPIVATRVGGVPDLLSAETATLVPPDQPEALARAILSIRSDPESARKKVQAGRAAHESGASAPSWLDRYEDVYREVTRCAPRRPEGEPGGAR